jgi:hypothetical protein
LGFIYGKSFQAKALLKLKSKTILYLSIIISSFFVGKIFNPIPVTNYALYVIVTALFMPYFGKLNCIKIVVVLLSVSMVQDIPFYLMFYQQWPSIYSSVMVLIESSAPATYFVYYFSMMTSTFNPGIIQVLQSVSVNDAIWFGNGLLAIESNSLVVVLLIIGAIYVGLINGLLVLSKIYKRLGIYKRLMF